MKKTFLIISIVGIITLAFIASMIVLDVFSFSESKEVLFKVVSLIGIIFIASAAVFGIIKTVK